MSDPSGFTLQSFLEASFEAALHDYEAQTGMRLIEHPLARQLESCNSVESITAVLQEQARDLTEFRRDEDKVMKPLKRVVHVLHVFSTNLPFPHAKAISAAFAILLRAIKDASASYDALVDLLEFIEHFLVRLDIYNKFPPTAPTAAMGKIIVKIMVELLSTIALVTKQINQKRPLKLIKTLLGEKEVDSVLHRLDRLTQDEARITTAQTLEVIYGLVQNMRAVMNDGKASADGIRDSLEIMQDIASKINKSQREKLLRDARKWVAPPDPWENHNSAQELHCRGTSTWFIHGNTYGEWKSSASNSLLWIHGKPGAGKSILCSTVIEDIYDMRKSGLASLAFFYCDFRDDDKKNLRGLLSSLLVQFCDSSDSYSAILSDFYSEHNNGSRNPSDKALIQCLKRILKHPGQAPVYIIIDALDECSNTFGTPTPREKVLGFVEELVDLGLGNLHICITSRPEADIITSLVPSSFNQISLDDESGQIQDIVTYVNSVISDDRRMKNWRAEDKELAIEVLTKKADGTFRWISYQLEVLRHRLSTRIRQALDDLPEGLDGIYERILQDIKEVNWKFAHQLFQCVAVAFRPLRVEELAEFLAFDFDARSIPTFRADFRPDNPVDAVLSTCSSLLAVVKVEGSAFIKFSHYSVREFLMSTRLAQTSQIISRFHVSMTPAHTTMARACLGILLHLDEQRITSDSLKGFLLAEYAAEHWVDHARFNNVSANTQDDLKRLFDPRRPHLRVLVWIYDPEIPQKVRSERPSRPRGTCLHYAALSGLPDLVKSLVTELSPDLNAPSFFNDVTPLHLASRDRHVEVARVLLELGANVMTRDVDESTPLHLASGRGHVDIARLLLDHGADVHAQNKNGQTPFELASKEGHHEVAELLLEFEVTKSVAARNTSSYHQSVPKAQDISSPIDYPPPSGARLTLPNVNLIQASDILVDGFIALTFSPEDAQLFFALLLRTRDFLRNYRISYLTEGIWYMMKNPPYFTPLPPGVPTQNVLLPLDFSVTTTQGTVVPQRRWSPADEIDVRRYVESAALQLPIYFVNRNGKVGFWLPDILQGRDQDLLNGHGEAPLGGRSTTHIRLNWPGCDFWKRQIPTRDETHIRNPITCARFMRHVGTSVDKFFNQCMRDGYVGDPNWRIGMQDITQRHVKIIGTVQVSAGTWMPIIQLTRHVFQGHTNWHNAGSSRLVT